MRVYEVAREFKLTADQLIHLLRGMGVQVRSEASLVDDSVVSRIRARFERERRAGHGESAEEALEAVMEDAQVAGRRRRRRKVEEALEAVEGDADSSADVVADAAEAMAAEAAEAAAERGAELVTTGGEEPKHTVIFVESPGPILEAEAVVEAAAAAEAPEAPAAPPVVEVEAPAARAEVVVEAPPAPPREEVAPLAPPRPEAPRRQLRRAADVLGRTPRPAAPAAGAGAPERRAPAPAASAGPGGQVRIQAEGFTADGRRKAKDKKKKKRRVDAEQVQENIARTMAELKSSGRKRRHAHRRDDLRAEREEERLRLAEEEATQIRVNEFLTIAELAELIDHSPTEIISSAFKNLGMMVTINQRLDFDQIELLLDEFGFQAVREEEYGAEMIEELEEEEDESRLSPRPPVVTVMGHVDHGKTSLLDYVRKTNVIAGEAGGITQHIGAYHVKLSDGRAISFLDTPGHAAFTAMRARGAEVTDVVILVVAADDAVMPQTVEAISHARNAGVPIVVAINKIDLPGANPARVKQELLNHQVVVEEFGGEVLSAEISAKKGIGIEDLLDKVLLQAEMLDVRANPDRPAQGSVIEAQLDVGKGPVATVLVTNGTLRVGDSFVCGLYDGRVRALLDERGNHLKEAGPATPAQVLGISGVPQAGDSLVAMDALRAAEIAQTRQRLDREKQLRIKSRGVKLTDISKLLAAGEQAQLNLVIKGDVDGSVQALSDALEQLSTGEVQVQVIHRAVGAINESDVLLAATAGAIIIGFHVRPSPDARNVATREGVDIRLYNIIYEAVEDVRNALEGMLAPEEKEIILGTAEVRQLFKVPRVGTVAGCMVTHGTLDRRGRVRVVRDGVQVYDGELGSLKRFKDDVREVREGFECGLNVAGYNDIKIGDLIECYRVEEVARTLAGAAQAEAQQA
ncbi:MAG TPA: translation initiation factor IF-2 [Longimicrobiales bacterium]|nr:translation initiation factor IF-2 [Longimicrobiales bacterium]